MIGAIVMLAGIVSGVFGVIAFVRGFVELSRATGGSPDICPQCEYNLATIAAEVCPECGLRCTAEDRRRWTTEGRAHVAAAGRQLGVGFMAVTIGTLLVLMVGGVLLEV